MKLINVILTFFVLLLSMEGFSQDTAVTIPKKNWQIFPIIAANPETSWIFGVGAVFTFEGNDTIKTDFKRVSTYSPLLIYTLRNQVLFENLFEYYTNNGWNGDVELRFASFPDRFFGIGSYSDAAYEKYSNKQFRFKASGRKKLGDRWFVGVQCDANYDKPNDFEKGFVLDTTYVEGENGGFYWGAGPSLIYDSRNNTIFPTKGAWVKSEATYYPDGVGNAYQTNRYTLDARKYLPVGKKKRNVIALRAFFAHNSGNDIPFTKLEELGGDDKIRGFHSQRYMDKAVIHAQAEYRFTIWRFIGMATFAGVGDVYNDNWDFSNPKYGGGVGLRIQVLPTQRLNLRIDYAIGTDWQKGFYLGFKEAF